MVNKSFISQGIFIVTGHSTVLTADIPDDAEKAYVDMETKIFQQLQYSKCEVIYYITIIIFLFDRVALKIDAEKLRGTQSQLSFEVAVQNHSRNVSSANPFSDSSQTPHDRIDDANDSIYLSEHKHSDLMDTPRCINAANGFISSSLSCSEVKKLSPCHFNEESDSSQPFLGSSVVNQNSLQCTFAKKSRIEAVDQQFDFKLPRIETNELESAFLFNTEELTDNRDAMHVAVLQQTTDNAGSTQVWSNAKDMSESVLTMMEDEDW